MDHPHLNPDSQEFLPHLWTLRVRGKGLPSQGRMRGVGWLLGLGRERLGRWPKGRLRRKGVDVLIQ